MPSFLERIVKSVLDRIVKKGIKEVFKKKKKDEDPPAEPSKVPSNSSSETEKSHPWRLCPIGESWIQTHPLTVPESEKGPEWETIRHGHCRKTLRGRNVCTADELREIARLYFKQLLADPNAMPTPDLTRFPKGAAYDLSIAGWTKFWNEIFKPSIPLTPDFLKALIATESSFIIQKDTSSKAGPARGLIQITEQTRKILQDSKGEIRDHLIEMTVEESRDPEVNIGAGVRWLHHKRKLATHHLNREATWEEAVAEYKGITQQLAKGGQDAKDIMNKLRTYHQYLQQQRASK